MKEDLPQKMPVKHWWWLVGCLGLLFGLVSLLPTMLFRFDASYRGLEMLPYDAQLHYAARVQEVRDGHPGLGNVFLPKKDLPFAQPPLPEIVIAVLGRFVGANAAWSLMISQILFGGGVFVMLAVFLAEVISNRRAALLGAVSVTFVGFLPSYIPWLLALLQGNWLEVEGLSFGRPINPQWSVFWTALAMWAMVRWLKRQDVRMLWIMLGSFCVLVYSYVYAWTIVGVLVIMTLTLSWRGLRKVSFKQIGGLMAVGGVVLAPYLFNMHTFLHHPLYSSLAKRMGVVMTHQPILNITVLVLAVLVGLLWKKVEAVWMYLVVIVIALIGVINQQLITGRYLQPGHYHWYFIKPFSIAIVTTLLFSWVSSRRWFLSHARLTRIGWTVLLVSGVVLSILYQYSFFMTQTPLWQEEQKGAGVVNFFKEYGEPSQIIFAPRTLSDELAVYTDKDVYISSNHVAYLTSTQELAERYFFERWTENPIWTPDWSSKSFRCEIGLRLYTFHFVYTRGSCDAFTESERQEWVQAFEHFSRLTNSEKLRLHGLDYVVLPLSVGTPPDLAPFIQKIFSDQFYQVYKVLNLR